MRFAGLVFVMAADFAQFTLIFYYTWAKENISNEALAPNRTGSQYV
jgi:hypothetical protein